MPLRNIRIRYERGRVVDRADGSRAVMAHNPIIDDLDDPQAFAGVLVQQIEFRIDAGDMVPHLFIEMIPTGSVTIEGPTNVHESQNRLNPNSETPVTTEQQTDRQPVQRIVEAMLDRDPRERDAALGALAEYLNVRYRECLPPGAMQRALGNVNVSLPVTEDMITRSYVSDVRQTASESIAAVFQRMVPATSRETRLPLMTGRISRQDFTYTFNGQVIGVEEVRTHMFPDRLIDMVLQWDPLPSATELICLADLLRRYLPGVADQAFSRLFEVASRSIHPGSWSQPPNSGIPVTTGTPWSPAHATNQRSIQLDRPGRPARAALDV